MTIVTVVDTETTGFDAEKDVVLEIAAVRFDVEALRVVDAQTRLLHYAGKIPPQARAVHHISPEEVRRSPHTLKGVWRELALGEAEYLAAHNATFDAAFLPDHPRWLCTYKAALVLYPDADGHSNQVLRYWLGVEPDLSFAAPDQRYPHRALYDALTTAAILAEILRHPGVSPETLARVSAAPALLSKCAFGKHRGNPWREVPNDYLQWLAKQPDLTPDVRHTVDHHLSARLRGEYAYV